MELSPEDIRKDKGKILPPEFKIYIFFDDFCATCSPYTTEIEDLCEVCRKELGDNVIDQWKAVRQTADSHVYPSLEEGAAMFQGTDMELLEETLKKPLKFEPNYYRIWKPIAED